MIGAIVAWWLSRQRLMAKPWLEAGRDRRLPGTGASSLPAAKIGLGVFLAVVGSLFALLISAYFMRMQLADWRAHARAEAAVVQHGCADLEQRRAAMRAGCGTQRTDGRRQDRPDCRRPFAFAFLVGQLLAWRQLNAAGYFLAANPANAFFYLITALHGLHLLGGLVALGRTADKVWRGFDARPGALERGAVRRLLAFSARRLAGPFVSADRLGD